LQLVSPVFPADKWVFDGPDGEETIDLPQGSLQVNSSELVTAAMREGMGLGLIPAYAAMDALGRGEIRRVLPDYTSQEMTVFALYPSRQYLDAKIRTWVDFLRTELPSILSKDQSEI
jgi:DNA-binding transcriptional LysR family regulator